MLRSLKTLTAATLAVGLMASAANAQVLFWSSQAAPVSWNRPTPARVDTLSRTLNRHGFRAVFMRAAAPGGGQWLQRSERPRPRWG